MGAQSLKNTKTSNRRLLFSQNPSSFLPYHPFTTILSHGSDIERTAPSVAPPLPLLDHLGGAPR